MFDDMDNLLLLFVIFCKNSVLSCSSIFARTKHKIHVARSTC